MQCQKHIVLQHWDTFQCMSYRLTWQVPFAVFDVVSNFISQNVMVLWIQLLKGIIVFILIGVVLGVTKQQYKLS